MIFCGGCDFDWWYKISWRQVYSGSVDGLSDPMVVDGHFLSMLWDFGRIEQTVFVHNLV